MRETTSVCRICSGFCGLKVTVDDQERVRQVRGDRANPISRGYACPKGLRIPEGLNSPKRLLHPLKRLDDGTFVSIPLEQALDEIADRLRAIIAESGGPAVSTFGGTSLWFNSTLVPLLGEFLAAIGSPMKFSTATIDQSAHQVTEGRMGIWAAGRQRFEDSDVALIIGSNPVVSLGAYYIVSTDPIKRFKDARARGLKLIVIDPRKTETAHFADCFLQLIPGQDATVLAGLIHLVLAQGWEDKAFCAEFVDGVEDLRHAVEPFTPEYVASRAGIDAADLERAAAMFARDGQRGIAVVGTGGTMTPHSNLVDHLAEALNVLCGRYLRAGERVPNPGIVGLAREFRAQVLPPFRSWEQGPKLPSGHGQLFGEFPTGMLADQLLRKDAGRIRAMFVNGANPAVCMPDQRRAVAGLRALDLLVTIDPYMSATAQLSHYILPPRLPLERHDVTIVPWIEQMLAPVPFAQYVAPVVEPPAGSEVIDDWYLYWALAKRLGLALNFAGRPMPGLEPVHSSAQTDGCTPPTTPDLLAQLLEHSRVPLDVLRQHPAGYRSEEVVEVLPAEADACARLAIAPPDIVAEIAEVLAERQRPSTSPRAYHLISRRERTIHNSVDLNFMDQGERGFETRAYFNPEDLASLGLAEGSVVRIESDTGSMTVLADSETALRRGVISMSHCRGTLPDAPDADPRTGASTNLLTNTRLRREPINAMPTLTAIPVSVVAA